jgi:hypothetical protein
MASSSWPTTNDDDIGMLTDWIGVSVTSVTAVERAPCSVELQLPILDARMQLRSPSWLALA